MKLFFSLFLISQSGTAATSNAATSNAATSNEQWEKIKKVDPIVNVNRFLTLGGLDEYMDQNVKMDQSCQEDWKQLGNKCLILLKENQKKIDQKRSCLQLGAKLVTVNSKKENDEILQFLTESNFDGTADRIWLGMNSGKRAGNYVIDNSRPQKTIDWFNWDQNSDSNESGSKNSIQMNTITGTWFRKTRNGSAAAICSKPILTK